jgi:hypothetical protein
MLCKIAVTLLHAAIRGRVHQPRGAQGDILGRRPVRHAARWRVRGGAEEANDARPSRRRERQVAGRQTRPGNQSARSVILLPPLPLPHRVSPSQICLHEAASQAVLDSRKPASSPGGPWGSTERSRGWARNPSFSL